MLIICPSCATSYDVEPATLRPDGRQVRCVRCRTVWHAEINRADRLSAAAAALDPAYAPEVPADIQADPLEEPAETAVGGHDAQWSVEADDVAADSGDDVVDDSAAEVAAPPIAPVDFDAGRPPIDVDALSAEPPKAWDIERAAAQQFRRGAGRQRPLWSLSRLQTVILALVIVDAILVGWRSDIVRVLPQTAGFYSAMGLSVNLRGLGFAAVATSTEAHEGVPILVVQGEIINQTGAVVTLPRLKLAVRDAAKREIYSWAATPPQATLQPYQAVAFRSRLASPPPDSRDVLVRFLNRRDVVAETR
jgi:predicted Zn finger-like uncharacterized protein